MKDLLRSEIEQGVVDHLNPLYTQVDSFDQYSSKQMPTNEDLRLGKTTRKTV